jgi:hypothetical protein
VQRRARLLAPIRRGTPRGRTARTPNLLTNMPDSVSALCAGDEPLTFATFGEEDEKVLLGEAPHDRG